ncbi:MAG: hypoxanthine phosphoribosyltransferase [Ignavibacteriaceae bacterium]|nr:hypoxanthine phosphoribosyltransferase [Ignavibacteriaceae bacterium]
MDEIIIKEDHFTVFLDEATIQKRVKELSEELLRAYKGKTPIFIGILNGAFPFLTDLVKNYNGLCEVEFMKLSSYGDAKISSGNVKVVKELEIDISGKDIIIVEDIVDTGLSVKYIERMLESHNPASVAVVTLLLKPESLKYNVKIDYIGFSIPSKFVIGYGLDYEQKYRNLKAIYALK